MSDELVKQEPIVIGEEINQAAEELIESISRFVSTLKTPQEIGQTSCPECGRPFDEEDMTPEPLDESAEVVAALDAPIPAQIAQQEIPLCTEIDQCSSVLWVRNRFGVRVKVPRGRWIRIDVAIDCNGYWYWWCGNSRERSRGAPNFRARVKRLKVWHSPNSRKITWRCFDLL